MSIVSSNCGIFVDIAAQRGFDVLFLGLGSSAKTVRSPLGVLPVLLPKEMLRQHDTLAPRSGAQLRSSRSRSLLH